MECLGLLFTFFVASQRRRDLLVRQRLTCSSPCLNDILFFFFFFPCHAFLGWIEPRNGPVQSLRPNRRPLYHLVSRRTWLWVVILIFPFFILLLLNNTMIARNYYKGSCGGVSSLPLVVTGQPAHNQSRNRSGKRNDRQYFVVVCHYWRKNTTENCISSSASTFNNIVWNWNRNPVCVWLNKRRTRKRRRRRYSAEDLIIDRMVSPFFLHPNFVLSSVACSRSLAMQGNLNAFECRESPLGNWKIILFFTLFQNPEVYTKERTNDEESEKGSQQDPNCMAVDEKQSTVPWYFYRREF